MGVGKVDYHRTDLIWEVLKIIGKQVLGRWLEGGALWAMLGEA